MTPRPLLGAAIAAAAALGLTTLALPTTAPATASPTAAPTGTGPSRAAAEAPYQLRDGRSAPIYDYGDAVRETVYVTAPDYDGDGAPDRVAADIVRPVEAERDGIDVPVIMDASPYYLSVGRGNEGEFKTYAEDGTPEQFPLFYDNYFVPRGYAFVAVDMAGTARSTGCVDQGGVSDVGSVEAVVRWLNGNAEAVDADGEPVLADWTDGRTGMIGKSYDGTLANGVAATGVEGLETIVPISAISSWYDYDRSQGLPFSLDYAAGLSRRVAADRTEPIDCTATLAGLSADGDDATGAYNAFWAERDHRQGPVTNAANVTASVFVYHGLQDLNVKTRNFSRWWAQLGRHGVTRKMWLTRVGHVDPFDTDRSRWVRTLHRWFDSELMGIDNGILDEPRVDVETTPNSWRSVPRWPTGRRTTFYPRAGSRLLAAGAGTGGASWLNQPNLSEANALSAGSEANRLLFATNPLDRDTRISGEATARLRITSRVPTGQVGVMLVDYGLGSRVLASGDGASTTETESCWGASVEFDDACYFGVQRTIGTTPLQVLGRGWARLDGAGTRTATVRMDPDDTIVARGHRLGLVLVGAAPSRLRTVDTSPTSRYTIDLAASSVSIPGTITTTPAGAGRRDSARSAGTASWLPEPGDLPRGTVAPATPRFLLPR